MLYYKTTAQPKEPKKMQPAATAFYLTTIWLILAIAATLHPSIINYWQIFGIIILLIALIETWRIKRQTIPNLIQIQRLISAKLPIGVWKPVTLRLHNPSTFPRTIEIFDDYPTHCDIQNQPQHVRV